tara:strand:- start:316 stop:1152 length:837 start_codon:yes stop_codon:yes gene_type:complete
MIIGIVGSSGFVGSNILKSLENSENEIILFDRNISVINNTDNQHVSFTLENIDKTTSIPNIDCLIFCAYDFKKKGWDQIKKTNVDGTIAFINKIKKKYDSKIIYISSLSAFEGCKSLYGKAKLIIESKINDENTFIIKPGLIYSKKNGGFVQKLLNIIKFSPFLLLPVSSKNKIFMTKIESVLFIINLILLNKIYIDKPLPMAENKPKSFLDIIKFISRENNLRIPYLLIIPDNIFKLLLLLIEKFGFNFSRDNFISLVNNKENYNFKNFNKIISDYE